MKKVSRIFLMLFLFSFIVRFTFVVFEYNHECEDDDCPICEIINSFNSDIRKIIPNIINIVYVIIIPILLLINIVKYNIISELKTLITLKVELLN